MLLAKRVKVLARIECGIFVISDVQHFTPSAHFRFVLFSPPAMGDTSLTLHVSFPDLPTTTPLTIIEESLHKSVTFPIVSSTIPCSPKGEHRGFAFLSFDSSEAAATVFRTLNEFHPGTRIDLKVQFQKSKRKQKKKKPVDVPPPSFKTSGSDIGFRSKRGASKPKHPAWNDKAFNSKMVSELPDSDSLVKWGGVTRVNI